MLSEKTQNWMRVFETHVDLRPKQTQNCRLHVLVCPPHTFKIRASAVQALPTRSVIRRDHSSCASSVAPTRQSISPLVVSRDLGPCLVSICMRCQHTCTVAIRCHQTKVLVDQFVDRAHRTAAVHPLLITFSQRRRHVIIYGIRRSECASHIIDD